MSVQQPSRVAAETPRGDIRTGDVAAREWHATARSKELRLLVDFGGPRLWMPADDVEPVTDP